MRRSRVDQFVRERPRGRRACLDVERLRGLKLNNRVEVCRVGPGNGVAVEAFRQVMGSGDAGMAAVWASRSVWEGRCVHVD